MIDFKTEDGKEYFIVFYHINNAVKKKTLEQVLAASEGSGCRLYEKRNGEKKRLKAVFCKLHHKDRFNYETGRKFALTRLLESSYLIKFSKEIRKEIWKKYFDRNKKFSDREEIEKRYFKL